EAPTSSGTQAPKGRASPRASRQTDRLGWCSELRRRRGPADASARAPPSTPRQQPDAVSIFRTSGDPLRHSNCELYFPIAPPKDSPCRPSCKNPSPCSRNPCAPGRPSGKLGGQNRPIGAKRHRPVDSEPPLGRPNEKRQPKRSACRKRSTLCPG